MKDTPWNEYLFNRHIRFVDKQWLTAKLEQSRESHEHETSSKLLINHSYQLYKDMFGVMIETGSFEVKKIVIREALDLLNRFARISIQKDKVEFHTIQNLEGVIETAKQFDQIIPDAKAVAGYEINHELVFYQSEPHSCIILKYKENPEGIFLVYRLYFSLIKDELFLVIEKSF